MTHVLPDQSPPKGELRKAAQAQRVNPNDSPASLRRTEVQGNYERWRQGWVKELLRGGK